MRALRVSAHGHRALTTREVDAVIAPVLQPVRAKYGGQGLAKTSTYVNIASETFLEEFTVLFDEHVDGFNGKSYVKMGKAQEDMLWKQKLREKRRLDGDASDAVAAKKASTTVGKARVREAATNAVGATTSNVDSARESAIAAYRALKAKKRGVAPSGKKKPSPMKW